MPRCPHPGHRPPTPPAARPVSRNEPLMWWSGATRAVGCVCHSLFTYKTQPHRVQIGTRVESPRFLAASHPDLTPHANSSPIRSRLTSVRRRQPSSVTRSPPAPLSPRPPHLHPGRLRFHIHTCLRLHPAATFTVAAATLAAATCTSAQQRYSTPRTTASSSRGGLL